MSILGNAAENERPFLKYDMWCIEETQYISIYIDGTLVCNDQNAGGT